MTTSIQGRMTPVIGPQTTPLDERRSFQSPGVPFHSRRNSVTHWLAQVVAQTPTLTPTTIAQRSVSSFSLEPTSSSSPLPSTTHDLSAPRHSPDRSGSNRGCRQCAVAQEQISRLKAQLAALEWQLTCASKESAYENDSSSRSNSSQWDASTHSVMSRDKKMAVTLTEDSDHMDTHEDVTLERKSSVLRDASIDREYLQPPRAAGPLDGEQHKLSELPSFEGESLDDMLRHGKLRELLAQAAVSNPDPEDIRVVRQTLSSKTLLTLDDLMYDRRSDLTAAEVVTLATTNDATEAVDEEELIQANEESGSISPRSRSRIRRLSETSFTSVSTHDDPDGCGTLSLSISPRSLPPSRSRGTSLTCLRCTEGSLCTCAITATTTTPTATAAAIAPTTIIMTAAAAGGTATTTTAESKEMQHTEVWKQVPPKHNKSASRLLRMSAAESKEHNNEEPVVAVIHTPSPQHEPSSNTSVNWDKSVRRGKPAAHFKFPADNNILAPKPNLFPIVSNSRSSSVEDSSLSEPETRSLSPRVSGGEISNVPIRSITPPLLVRASTPPLLVPHRSSTPPLPAVVNSLRIDTSNNHPGLDRQRTPTPKHLHHLQILAPIRESTEAGTSPPLQYSPAPFSPVDSLSSSNSVSPRSDNKRSRSPATLSPLVTSQSSGRSPSKERTLLQRTNASVRRPSNVVNAVKKAVKAALFNSNSSSSSSSSMSPTSPPGTRSPAISPATKSSITRSPILSTASCKNTFIAYPSLTITSPHSYTPVAKSHSPTASSPRIDPNFLTIDTSQASSTTSYAPPFTSTPRRRKSWPFDPIPRSQSEPNLTTSTTPPQPPLSSSSSSSSSLAEEKIGKRSPQQKTNRQRPVRPSRSPSPLSTPIESLSILRKQLDIQRAVERKKEDSSSPPLYTAHLALNALSCVSRWAARIQEFEDPTANIHDTFKHDIFLGGACNPTTWRQTIAIPLCESMGVSYYNPQVENWTPDLVQIEAQAKEDSYILLFIVASETRAIASLVEASEYISSGRNVILVVDMIEPGQSINSKPLSKEEVDDLNRARRYLIDVCTRYGVLRFPTVESGLAEGIEQIQNRRRRQERYTPLGEFDSKEDPSRHPFRSQ